MKTRIKVITHADGSKLYLPQYRFFFCWFHFQVFRNDVWFISEADAHEFLDKKINETKAKKKLIADKKTESINYISHETNQS